MSTIQYSKTELYRKHVLLRSMHLVFEKALSTVSLQPDVIRCFFLAARAAEREGEWTGASKGLSERAPFPLGHILHYPPG